ncbi:unnamed protein product [marine sediment metagenome]|uniref:Uncharacterized protein n=1 Tax=marine sediment metagenome TaxID=412755 RepID=X0RVW9_9ZZZZ
MVLKSKKKLFETLERFRPTYFSGVVSKGLRHPKISNETYGQMSCIYIYCADGESAIIVKRELRISGFKINEYDPERAIEVHVSYFKGHHWDE